ncbi:MAG: signal peptidase II [Myxococcota bacterium]
MNRRNLVFVIVLLIGLVLDQVTKLWIVANLPEGGGEIRLIPGLFSIVHRQNPGAAFGMFRDWEYRHWMFVAFTVLAAGVILDLFRRLPTTDRFMAATLGLILSGAVGNAIDRIHKQTVTDFLKVYTDIPALKTVLIRMVGTNEWPSFNIADSALVIGVLMYVFHSLFLEEKAAEPAPGQTAPPNAG